MKHSAPIFTRLNIASAIIALTILFYLALSIYPGSMTKLVIESSSEVAGTSQLFFYRDAGYAESASALNPLNAGKTRSEFALVNLKSPLRWDPSQADNTIKIDYVGLTLLGFNMPIATKLEQLHDIASIEGSVPNLTINIVKGSNDPQISISFSAGKLNAVQRTVHVAIAIFAALLVTIFLTKGRYLFERAGMLESYAQKLTGKFSAYHFSGREIFALISMAALLNIYFISSLSLSIDDEMGAIRQNPEIWISQGRWAVYIIEKFLFTQPAIPFAPYIFLCVCLGFSYVLTLKLHRLNSDWKTYLTYPIYCAFPTWWFIAEFSSNVPAAALGWLLITGSVLVGFRSATLNPNSINVRLLQRLGLGLCIAVAIACYQSLILLYAALTLGALLITYLKEDSTPYTFKQALTILLSLAINLIVGAALYVLINKFSLSITGQQSAYLSNFVKIDDLIMNPIEVTLSVASEAMRIYTGSATRFGAGISLMMPILVLCSLIVWFKGRRPFLQIALWSCMLLSPFALHFIAGAGNMPMRTMLTLAYCAWLMSFLTISQPQKTISIVGIALTAVLTVQILNVSSQYMATATITQQHDRALAADIYAEIGSLSSTFDVNTTTTVDIYGYKPFSSIYASGWTSTMNASFFSWDNGNLTRMLAYMHVMGYPNLSMPTQDVRTSNIASFADMPVWPAKGSVKRVGNQYLVKLGSDADPSHAIKN